MNTAPKQKLMREREFLHQSTLIQSVILALIKGERQRNSAGSGSIVEHEFTVDRNAHVRGDILGKFGTFSK